MTSVMPSVTTSILTAAALGFLVLAALVAYAATRPDAFRVARTSRSRPRPSDCFR